MIPIRNNELVTPKISDGPTSQALKVAIAALTLLTAVQAFLDGNHDATMLATGLTAAGFLVTLAASKALQAYAWIRSQQNLRPVEVDATITTGKDPSLPRS